MSLLAFIPLIGEVLKRIIPDPAKAQEVELELIKQLNTLDVQQIEVNKTEAQHASIFVAGWRPFIGWVCGIALAMRFLILPTLAVILPLFGVVITLPEIAMSELMGILGGILGLGGLRTFEKVKEVARTEITTPKSVGSSSRDR